LETCHAHQRQEPTRACRNPAEGSPIERVCAVTCCATYSPHQCLHLMNAGLPTAWSSLVQASLKTGQTAYRLIGAEGPVLLCLHGAFSFSYIFQDLVRRLQRDPHDDRVPMRILLMDFHGRGRSPWPGTEPGASTAPKCTMEFLSTQVEGLLAFLGLASEPAGILIVGEAGSPAPLRPCAPLRRPAQFPRPQTSLCHLAAGYDMGAAVGAAVAARSPGLVAGLAMLSPAGIPRASSALELLASAPLIGGALFRARAVAALEAVHHCEIDDHSAKSPHADLADLHWRMCSWQAEHTPGYIDAVESTLRHFPLGAGKLADMYNTLPFLTQAFAIRLLLVLGERDSTVSPKATAAALQEVLVTRRSEVEPPAPQHAHRTAPRREADPPRHIALMALVRVVTDARPPRLRPQRCGGAVPGCGSPHSRVRAFPPARRRDAPARLKRQKRRGNAGEPTEPGLCPSTPFAEGASAAAVRLAFAAVRLLSRRRPRPYRRVGEYRRGARSTHCWRRRSARRASFARRRSGRRAARQIGSRRGGGGEGARGCRKAGGPAPAWGTAQGVSLPPLPPVQSGHVSSIPPY